MGCGSYLTGPKPPRIYAANPYDGAVAQLGERHVRNVEVRGSIPLGSTNRSLLGNQEVSSFPGFFFSDPSIPGYPDGTRNRVCRDSLFPTLRDVTDRAHPIDTTL